jgi:hypothetical protein
MRRLLLVALATAGLVAAAAAPAQADPLVLRGVGSPPLSDGAAGALVRHSAWEPRPENHAANQRVPTAQEMAYFHSHSDMPNHGWVTGNYRGTTDEIIQWAAYKWGFAPDLFRAVATLESWWKMSTVGNEGDAFGLFQVRRPYHCCIPLAAQSSAFNADYYGAILRAYYDGKQGWLNTVERAQEYRAGDLWGSVGVWASGRWHLGSSDWYVGQVQQRLRERTWQGRWF